MFFFCFLSGALPAAAQEPSSIPGSYARVVILQPHPGEREEFEAGYARHIEWHRAHNDPWTWYGWTFVLGDRLDLFMDGTFGHSPEDFDSSVDPAGDRADNALNVTPYADFISHGMYEHLEELSRGTALPDTSAYLSLTTYRVLPGQGPAFEAAIAAHGRRSGQSDRFAWFRLQMGGAPQYLLMRPVATFGAAALVPDFFGASGVQGGPEAPSIDELVESIRNELLGYHSEFSYLP